MWTDGHRARCDPLSDTIGIAVDPFDQQIAVCEVRLVHSQHARSVRLGIPLSKIAFSADRDHKHGMLGMVQQRGPTGRFIESANGCRIHAA